MYYEVSSLVDDIFVNEFDSDSSAISEASISGWLENNLGALNALIYSSFYQETGIFEPTGCFGQEERAIYKNMFLKEHYSKKARQTLRGIDSSTILSFREGDSSVTRMNKNEVAKVYKSMSQSANEELMNLINSYNIFKSAPVQVAGTDSIHIPSSERLNRF